MMTGDYRITIHVWPYSTGKGADVDQAAAGERVNTFTVPASGMDEAFDKATLIARGMMAHPAVWKAPITAIAIVQPGEEGTA